MFRTMLPLAVRVVLPLALAFGALACTTAPAPREAKAAVPLVDHHQHFFSPATEALLAGPSGGPKAILAPEIVSLLDAAGIEKALVLSVAYMYGSPNRQVDDEYAKARAENDWTAAQAARYPERLRAFCGVNPLKDYALQELARCAASPGLKHGVKLHFGNSDIQVGDPVHLEKMRAFFKAANGHGMAIAMHMRASISKKRPYGAAQAKIFLEELLPLAPDVVVQVAHMAGAGPGYEDPPAQEAMGYLAEVMAKGDARTRRLYFDVASNADRAISPASAALLVRHIRHVGVGHILYGTDAATGDNLRPKDSWAAFRKLPLTNEEFDAIARNVAPYML